MLAKQPIGQPSTPLFRWAEHTEKLPASLQQSASSKIVAPHNSIDARALSDENSRSRLSVKKLPDFSNLGDSGLLSESGVGLHDSFPRPSRNRPETVESNKNWVKVPDFSGKEFGDSGFIIKPERNTSFLFESDSRKVLSSPAGTFGSTPGFSGKISQFKIAATESHPVQSISSSAAVQSSSTLPSSANILTTSSSAKPSITASSRSISSTKFGISSPENLDANQKSSQPKTSVSPSFSFPSTFSFSPSKDDALSSAKPAAINESSVSPESASPSNVALFDSEKNETTTPQITVSNPSLSTGESLKALASVTQPKLPTGTSAVKLEHAQPSIQTTEPVVTLKSDNQLSSGRISTSVMDLASNDKSQLLSTFHVNSTAAVQNSEISNDGRSLDVVTQEDEMEEEAPESSLATELSLGNLSGFGIGSAPASNTEKPSPFGLGVINKSATPVSSPFPPSAPTGELFRPASFSFQSPVSSQPLQPANLGSFSSGFITGSTNQVSAPSGFGQPAQFGVGQKALGSVLGSFGQSRQLGGGLPGSGISSPNSFGSGFPGVSSSGFGGGFATAASAGGGFSSLATGGGVGFASAATAGGGFASLATAGSGAGFGGAAQAGGGGFAAAATGRVGFGGAATSGSGFTGAGLTGRISCFRFF